MVASGVHLVNEKTAEISQKLTPFRSGPAPFTMFLLSSVSQNVFWRGMFIAAAKRSSLSLALT